MYTPNNNNDNTEAQTLDLDYRFQQEKKSGFSLFVFENMKMVTMLLLEFSLCLLLAFIFQLSFYLNENNTGLVVRRETVCATKHNNAKDNKTASCFVSF